METTIVAQDTTFYPFQKLARLSRTCVITEKIDGTNAQVFITDSGEMLCGSRTKYITPGSKTDNAGFAAWCEEHKSELLTLGPGRHYGEWAGLGIQRKYGATEKRFFLFNPERYEHNPAPSCCSIVPVLYSGDFTTDAVEQTLAKLAETGSMAFPGFMDPEGVVIFHKASGKSFKKTIKDDAVPKSSLEIK